MIVDEPRGLQVRIENGAAHKAKAALFQILAERVRDRTGGGHFGLGEPPMALGLAPHETPDVVVEAAKGRLKLEKRPRIGDGCGDLEPVADDAGIQQQLLDAGWREAGDLHRIEIDKRPPVAFPPVQDRGPGQARLGALENQKLELLAIIVDGHTPFPVVVLEVDGADALRPGAPDNWPLC